MFANWALELYVGSHTRYIGYSDSYVKVYLNDALEMVPEYLAHLAVEHDYYSRGGSRVDWELKTKGAEQSLLTQILIADQSRYFNLFSLRETLAELLISGNAEAAETLLRSHVLGLYVDYFFEHTRKIWVPACHEGSQSNHLAGYRALAEAVLDDVNEQQQERDKYWKE